MYRYYIDILYIDSIDTGGNDLCLDHCFASVQILDIWRTSASIIA